MPIVCGSGNPQIDLLRWQNQVGIIGIQIGDRIVFVPALIFPLLDLPVPTGAKYSYFIAGCTPVQPLVTLKKAFFLLAMNARKSYVASFCLERREITQCQLPPFVFPTALSGFFPLFRQRIEGLRCSGNNRCTYPTLHADFARSWASVGKSPQVGSITACRLKTRSNPVPASS